MNFLLHHHVAQSELGTDLGALGAMLPDVWRMADRRARARTPAAPAQTVHDDGLSAGVGHHLELDRWFHRTPFHDEGERAAQRALAQSGVTAPKLGLFAHVLWEMALDGALVRVRGLDSLRDVLRAGLHGGRSGLASTAARWGTLRAIPEGADRERFHRRVEHLLEEIARGPWIAGYAEPEGLCDRLSGVRSRFGLPPLVGDERHRVARAMEGLLHHAAGVLPELFARRALTRG